MSQLQLREPTRATGYKRLIIIVTGWAFLALGIVGLFLPFLQGILFILIGLIILSKEYHWAGRLLARARTRFPKLDAWIGKVHDKVDSVLGHKPQKDVRAAED